MLQAVGLDPTPLREAVFRCVGEESRPLVAAEIMTRIQSRMSINKVTLYRILDLLVDSGLVRRLSAGDRAWRYGMGASHHHPDHPHFVCSRCGLIECLEPNLLPFDLTRIHPKGKGVVRHVDVRFEGTCEKCLHGGN
ncbi:MAG: transcriptional repressor [Thermodesulfobacteriota bacterium]|nr:transcriptional repressor [Thermodesulfobacteriota bacterium]